MWLLGIGKNLSNLNVINNIFVNNLKMLETILAFTTILIFLLSSHFFFILDELQNMIEYFGEHKFNENLSTKKNILSFVDAGIFMSIFSCKCA